MTGPTTDPTDPTDPPTGPDEARSGDERHEQQRDPRPDDGVP